MSESFVIAAELRRDEGKGASRRLRRLEGKMPAVVYGGDKPAVSISVIRKDFEKHLENEAFYTAIIDITVDGTTEHVLLKDLQRHPSKDSAVHADFLRVVADKLLKVHVPLHFINETSCTGVKLGGGMIQHQATDIEVQCLPKDIPEFIEVDMLNVEAGQIVHISDLTLPEGVISTALALGEDHDLAIAAVIPPKGGKTDDDASEG
jgi:large subunit ribosomal protein L25